ncbi:MAG: hypothetical protein HQL76_06415 [Magnetococcales bacterium]|nr:hypothetical protein [Magnetococcales bacterium]
MNEQLARIIHGQLVRDRYLSARSASAISTHLNVEDPLLGLKPGVLKHREEYEVDLLVSPLFTPTMEDRAACEPSLPLEGITADDERDLIGRMEAQGLQCKVVFGDDSTVMSIPEVAIERHIHLLRLRVSVAESIHEALKNLLTGADLTLGMSYARSQIWTRCPHLLEECLAAMTARRSFTLDKFGFLRDFVRSYHPGDMVALVQALNNLLESYRIGNDRPVFNQQLEDHQATAIRSEHCGEAIQKYRVQMAHALLDDFGKGG